MAGTRSDPGTHQLPGRFRQENKTFILSRNEGSLRIIQVSGPLGCNTHIRVLVIKLHHDAGRTARHRLVVPEDLHLIENERLVPGGVEGVPDGHGPLGLMEKGHDCVGVCGGERGHKV